jgi:hypothetical protein
MKDLQGRSRQFPACLFETSEWERSVNMRRQVPLSRGEPTALVVLPIRSCYFCPNQSTFKIHWCYLTELINFMELPFYIYIFQRVWQILNPHDDMKISDMLLPISIYSSRGWQNLIPHDDMKISDMLFPISI